MTARGRLAGKAPMNDWSVQAETSLDDRVAILADPPDTLLIQKILGEAGSGCVAATAADVAGG